MAYKDKEREREYQRERRKDPKVRERECEYQRERYRKDPKVRERCKESLRERRKDPKVRERESESHREYMCERRKDPKVRERECEYRKDPKVRKRDRESHREYMCEYRKGPKFREYQREYWRERRKDPKFRLINCLRVRVRKVLLGSKSASTMELIGCSRDHLMAHLESMFQPGMTWENYGSVWHVDHIRPLAWFGDRITDPAVQREAFNFRNLQPMFGSENCSKGARYEGKYRSDDPEGVKA